MSAIMVALLRGVNVGRSRRVRMESLRASVDEGVVGLAGPVATLLASGNLLMRVHLGGDACNAKALRGQLEKVLRERLGLHDVPVVVKRADEIERCVQERPKGWHSDVCVAFLCEGGVPGRAGEAMSASDGSRALVSSCGSMVYLHTPGGYAKAKLNNNVLEARLLVKATTRSWNTVLALSSRAAKVESTASTLSTKLEEVDGCGNRGDKAQGAKTGCEEVRGAKRERTCREKLDGEEENDDKKEGFVETRKRKLRKRRKNAVLFTE